MRIRKGLWALPAVVFLFCMIAIFAVPLLALAAGTEVPLFLVAEDVGNGYRFEAKGIGGFTSNGKAGETVTAAAITVDSGVRAELLKNGEPTEFETDSLIIENGEYELFLYSEHDKEGAYYARYDFSVKNEFEGLLQPESHETAVIENPETSVSYNTDREMFEYRLPDGKKFWLSIPAGGMGRVAVRLELSDGVHAYIMEKDGENVLMPENMVFAEAGSYRIKLLTNELGTDGEESYQFMVPFFVLQGGPQNISVVNAPNSFLIQSVTLNGRALISDKKEYVQMKQDGTYVIEFTGKEDPTMFYEIKLLRDTTPPCLLFSVPVDGATLKESLSYTVPEPGTVIELFHNGAAVTASKNIIAQDGVYRMVVTDKAGNSREYNFVMKQGYRVFDYRMVILLAVLLAAGAGLMLYWRRNMRVL